MPANIYVHSVGHDHSDGYLPAGLGQGTHADVEAVAVDPLRR